MLTVLVPPVIELQPASLSVIAGTNASFSVTASGTPPPGYQWRFNGVDMASATGPSLALTNVAAHQCRQLHGGGDQRSRGGDQRGGSADGDGASRDRRAAREPEHFSRHECELQRDGFRHAPLAYQWQFNGADLESATGSGLLLTNVQPTNAGSYTVVVTNVAGVVTSGAGVLTVIVPPRIEVPPASLNVAAGTDVRASA